MFAASKARFLAEDGNVNHIVYKMCSSTDELCDGDSYTGQLDRVFLRRTNNGTLYAVFATK